MFLQSIYYTSLNDADKAQAYIQELIPGVKLIPRMLVSKYYRVSFETEETLSFWIKLTISENTNYVMFAWDEVLELEKEPTIKKYSSSQIVYYLDNVGTDGNVIVEMGLYTINCDLKPRYHARLVLLPMPLIPLKRLSIGGNMFFIQNRGIKEDRLWQN